MPPSAHQHVLFQRYPLTGQVPLSTGPAPTPYHIYAGYGAFIGGTADLAAVRALLKPEQVQALTTTTGRALMGIWALDFTEASLDPHHELQFSLFVTRQNAPPLPDQPLAVLEAIFHRPETRMLCHGLWNSTDRVVAYNREILGLNARRSRSQVALAGATLTCEFADAATGRPVLTARLPAARRPSFRAGLALARLLGWRGSQRLAAEPLVAMKVVNPIGLRPGNDAALACTYNDVSVLRYFDPRADTLTLADGTYGALGFQPQFVQHMGGIKFVYLNPSAE